MIPFEGANSVDTRLCFKVRASVEEVDSKFAEQTTVVRGHGQTTEMYRQANGVRVTCTFDRWEATSNSAWSGYLKGRQEAAALLRLVSLVPEDGILIIQRSVIAIGAAQPNLKHREYSNAPYRRGYYIPNDEVDLND